jgi:hypothetical protein
MRKAHYLQTTINLLKGNYLDHSGNIFDKIRFLRGQARIVFAAGSGDRDFLKVLGGLFIGFLNVRVK